jgi:hypothetical protein
LGAWNGTTAKMEQHIFSSFNEVAKIVLDEIRKHYWFPLHEYLAANPEFIETVTGFLVQPEKIVLYFGKTHIGIEYTGPERIDHLPDTVSLQAQIFDFTQSNENFLEQIIGFKYDDGSSSVDMPLPPFLEELIMPTNKGADKLTELNWRFDAQDSITFFNLGKVYLIENQFSRIVNGIFFDADENGLITRHIKWIDFIPVQYDDSDAEKDSIGFSFGTYSKKVQSDCRYIYPLPANYDYQHSRLQRVNRFIELVSNSKTSEPEITQFLSRPENHFILGMRFGAVKIHAEEICEWQSEDKIPIKPDFLVVHPNGFADIVEFKLPIVDPNIVGRENRESLSAQINTYVSQTRTYRNYFEDPNNREWFESKHDYRVYRPRRYLVIGRRWQFDSDIWREIVSDYTDLEIVTYDDLVDGVVAQLYM